MTWIDSPFKMRARRFRAAWLLACIALFAVTAGSAVHTAQKPPAPLYEWRDQHDPDGIGKFFMGREIAQVMGHQAADWLDRPERETEEQPEKMLDSLKLRPGMTVCDLGAGSGYLTFRIAKRIAPGGVVYAVDIQPEMLAIIRRKMAQTGIRNVKPVLGAEKDPRLPPRSQDLILLVDVYHEVEYPYELTQAMVRALKPGGRLALVEFKMEDPEVPIKRLHKMSEAQVKKEMALHLLDWTETVRTLPWQHVFIFRKRLTRP